MSKYSKSLTGPNPGKIHGGQYKAANICDADKGRVIVRGKSTISGMSRPEGRTTYVSGTKNAGTNAK